MANETITSGAGLRKALVMTLNTSGIADGDQNGADGYYGQNVSGIKTVALNVPDNTRVNHRGDDQPIAQDFLPPTELPSGTFSTAKTNQTLDAIISNQQVETLGDLEIDGLHTNKAGQEADVSFWYWRQALVTDENDSDFGLRRWQTFVLPKSRITAQGNTPDQGGDDVNNYSMTPTASLIKPWGETFTEEDNGFTRAVKLRITGDYPNMPGRWTGNATLATFNLLHTPISAAKIHVWNASTGAELTVNSVNTTNKTFTLSSAPGNDVPIFALYETTDAIS